MQHGHKNYAKQNDLFPVFIKLEKLKIIIIGGGKVGLEKLSAILRNSPNTKVHVLAPEIDENIMNMQSAYPNISVEKNTYHTDALDGFDLIFSAVNNEVLSQQIAKDARQKEILINAADKPELCDFYLSSIVAKGSLKIAISTNGKSPTLAKRLKEILYDAIPEDTEKAINNLEEIRNKLNLNFTEKVHKLNKITSSLAVNPDAEVEQIKSAIKWKTIAWLSLAAFFFMVIGYVVFSFIPIKEIGGELHDLATTIDKTFYWMIAVGFIAQLIDGALGMGYGVTSTAALLSIGIPLPAISGSIHTAEMFSSGASGFSHYKFGNINKKLLKALIIPGVIGSIAGAILLSVLGVKYASIVKPILAAYTMILGIRILNNAFKKGRKSRKVKRVGWLAWAGGFLDSFGGGGWGPLVTSTLISKGKTPRYVIGTVSLSEFFVTLASALTFFTFLGLSHWQVILGLIIGGIIAAPLAAKLSGKLPVKIMFICVGLMVILWSFNILLKTIF